MNDGPLASRLRAIAERRRKPRPWTEDDLQRLAAGLSEGRDFVSLGHDLDRNPDAVRSKAIDAGLWQPAPRAARQRRKRPRYNSLFGE